ncbi:hypothetical protein BD779DRAFT_1171393 [Infundibulicybe gibba]|nr:hypothetical protein BD779DRAFT_1171393 [Infundibulicybe gibba]
MPLDIIFEVASHLPPRGLVALSRTSEVLCRTLYSPSASSIWKAARSAVGAPDCSPGLSEPQWMSLIFGGPICQQCNTANVDKIDFSLRRRVCFDCKKQNMVPDVAFGELFPHYDTSIMDMVPYTRSGSWVLGCFKFFWKSDVERIASEWATLQKDIHISTKGAQAKAAAYRKQRIDEVEWITEHANVWDNWHHRFSVDEAYKKQKARDEAILERLLALGYDCRDYHYSDSEERIIHEDVEFTDQFWAHIQPKVVMLVESNRVRRLEQERADLRLERIRVLKPLYQEYAKSWAPTQWCYLPSVYELVNFPVVNDIVDADSSVSVSSSSFLPAIAQFPTLIPEWISAKKARITAMLDPPSPGPVNDPLDLAISVFKCTGHLKTWCPIGRSSRGRRSLRTPAESRIISFPRVERSNETQRVAFWRKHYVAASPRSRARPVVDYRCGDGRTGPPLCLPGLRATWPATSLEKGVPLEIRG